MKGWYKRITATVLAAAIVLAALSGCGTKLNFTTDARFYTMEGDTSEVLEIVERTMPIVMEKERDHYPIPSGVNKHSIESASKQEKQAVLEENKRLMNDSFSAIAENRLQKHPAADGQFGGTLASDAVAVSKRININPPATKNMAGLSTGGQRATGLYAPAGEVVTVTIPENLIGRGFTVNVGMWGSDTNVPAEKISNRMPILTKSFALTAAENKVGTPFGGAVYFCLNGYIGEPFSITVSGGVECPGYTLGVTGDNEWQRVRNAPGLYAEMRTDAVRLLVPSYAVRNIEDPRAIMEFWDKASSLSNTFMDIYDRQITMSFDFYVAAGAAVAFVGAWFCQMPMDWATNALSIESMLKNGEWGSLHEMNHHFQGTFKPGGLWGADSPGEVTNNVITAATYILYSNIASYRTEQGGLDGWNYVTDPYTNLKACLGGDSSLSQYIALMHSFGVDKFLRFVKSYYGEMGHVKQDGYPNYSAASRNDFALRGSRVFGVDMINYCTQILKWELTQSSLEAVAALKLPEYVPIANLYTSGTGKINTGRPFYIPARNPYTFDFRSRMATSKEDYTIKVSGFKYGKLKRLGGDRYEYTPPKNASKRDTFTLEVKFASGRKEILTGTIAQDPNMLTGKRYDDITAGNMQEARACETGKASVPVTSNIAGIPNYNVSGKDKTVKSLAVIEGKIVPAVTGNYTIYLKADDAAQLYFSETPGTSAHKALLAEVKKYSAAYNEKDSETYFNVRLEEGKEYYFKLYNFNSGGQGGARLGWKAPVYNASDPYVKPGENGISGEINEQQGKLVDIPNSVVYAVNAKVGVPKKSDFTSPYYYVRPFRVKTEQLLDKTEMTVLSVPAGTEESDSSFLIDGKTATYYHTVWNGNKIPAFPHDYTLDLGKTKTLNYVKVSTWRTDRDAIGRYEILAGTNPRRMRKVAAGESKNGVINVSFPMVNARYLTVRGLTNMAGGKYTVVSEIDVGTKIKAGTLYAHNSAVLSYSGNWGLDTDGAFANGGAAAGTGEVSFSFTGTGFGYYAKRGEGYGTALISIDGGGWHSVDLGKGLKYQDLAFAVTDLADRYHTVRIRSKGKINVDFISVNRTPEKKIGGRWAVIAAIIVAMAAGVSVAAINFKRKKS